jgi:RNA polymerase sigma factor (sigma-70 family)
MDDASLLKATAAGDADAFALFYRRHLPLVVGFAARMTRDREAAADLVGEVFAAALAGCARYQPTHVSAAPWLIGIAQNKVRESQRRGRVQDAVRQRLQMRPIELGEDDLERVDALASASYSDLLAAVQSLPEHERDAVRARIVEERDYWELAERLRCSESVVRQRVSRGLRRIRTQVSNRAKESET